MGRLIYFEDHHPALGQGMARRRREEGNGLIPLQIALDETDIEKCFHQVVRHGRCAVVPRANPDDAGRIVFLIRIDDALMINRQLLEEEAADSPGLTRRIDHIQMLENSRFSLLGRVWESVAQGMDSPAPSRAGQGVPDPLRQ